MCVCAIVKDDIINKILIANIRFEWATKKQICWIVELFLCVHRFVLCAATQCTFAATQKQWIDRILKYSVRNVCEEAANEQKSKHFFSQHFASSVSGKHISLVISFSVHSLALSVFEILPGKKKRELFEYHDNNQIFCAEIEHLKNITQKYTSHRHRFIQ